MVEKSVLGEAEVSEGLIFQSSVKKGWGEEPKPEQRAGRGLAVLGAQAPLCVLRRRDLEA